MVMKRNYTLNLFYVLCVVVVLLAYPVKNYSAIVTLINPTECVKKVEKPVAQQSIEISPIDFLFKF